MTRILAALLAAGTLAALTATPAAADYLRCSYSSVETKAPSGSYTDKNGRKWVGFNQDGTPPDSLTKDSDKSYCEAPV